MKCFESQKAKLSPGVSAAIRYLLLGVNKNQRRAGSGLPRWFSGKESACNAEVTGDAGLIPGSGRFPGEGNGNPLQYSCLETPMDRGA